MKFVFFLMLIKKIKKNNFLELVYFGKPFIFRVLPTHLQQIRIFILPYITSFGWGT